MWIQDEDHSDRYRWDEEERHWLVDVGDGSLIEIGQNAVCRYPVAHVDEDLGLIVNDIGQGWTREGFHELDDMTDEEVWEFMTRVGDVDDPFWDDPAVVKNG